MLEFQEKRKLRRFLYSRITLVILLVIIFFILKAVWGVYEKQSIAKENLKKISTNFNTLQGRELILTSEINRLKTDSGVEEEIREKYGLVKPGEEVLVIIDSDEVIGSTSVSSESTFWSRIINWFK